MQDHEDLIAAARKLAKAHLHDGQLLEVVALSYDQRYNEDQAILALAGCFVRGERLPKVETDRTRFYWFVPQS